MALLERICVDWFFYMYDILCTILGIIKPVGGTCQTPAFLARKREPFFMESMKVVYLRVRVSSLQRKRKTCLLRLFGNINRRRIRIYLCSLAKTKPLLLAKSYNSKPVDVQIRTLKCWSRDYFLIQFIYPLECIEKRFLVLVLCHDWWDFLYKILSVYGRCVLCFWSHSRNFLLVFNSNIGWWSAGDCPLL